MSPRGRRSSSSRLASARSSPGRNASSSASDQAKPASRIALRIASSVTTIGVMPARILQSTSVAVALTILADPRDPSTKRLLSAPSGTTLLKAAHDGGIDVTATCGGRGRCTSCRIKFIAGTIPPPTLADEVQLGDDLVREGYRLACQCRVDEPLTVQLAPPLEEQAFQILGAGPGVASTSGVTIDSGIAKQVVKVTVPREEHHQTSDLEQLLAAVGPTAGDVGISVMPGLPGALRDDDGLVTITT